MEAKNSTFHKILKKFKKPVLVDNRNWRKRVPTVDKYFSLLEKEISQFPKEKGMIVDPSIVGKVHCAVCNKEDYQQLFLKKGFYYVICKSCEHIYVRNPLKEEVVIQLYRSSDVDNAHIEAQEDEKYSKYQKKMAEKYLNILKALGIINGNLLDVGCGVGNFLSFCKEKALFTLYGIELNKIVYPKLINLLGKDNLYLVPIENVDFKDLRFKVITLWGVLEHLANPISVISRCVGLLEKDGYVLVLIPNLLSRAFKILGINTPTLNPRSHLQMFTKSSFEKMCENVGLEVVELFCELPVIDLMYDHIHYNNEIISDIIEQEESYYYVYLLRKIVY